MSARRRDQLRRTASPLRPCRAATPHRRSCTPRLPRRRDLQPANQNHDQSHLLACYSPLSDRFPHANLISVQPGFRRLPRKYPMTDSRHQQARRHFRGCRMGRPALTYPLYRPANASSRFHHPVEVAPRLDRRSRQLPGRSWPNLVALLFSRSRFSAVYVQFGTEKTKCLRDFGNWDGQGPDRPDRTGSARTAPIGPAAPGPPRYMRSVTKRSF